MAKCIYINLEELLKEKGVSKTRICTDCKIQRTQFNNYCKNIVTRMDFAILARICEYLDCEISDVLKLHDNDMVR